MNTEKSNKIVRTFLNKKYHVLLSIDAIPQELYDAEDFNNAIYIAIGIARRECNNRNICFDESEIKSDFERFDYWGWSYGTIYIIQSNNYKG